MFVETQVSTWLSEVFVLIFLLYYTGLNFINLSPDTANCNHNFYDPASLSSKALCWERLPSAGDFCVLLRVENVTASTKRFSLEAFPAVFTLIWCLQAWLKERWCPQYSAATGCLGPTTVPLSCTISWCPVGRTDLKTGLHLTTYRVSWMTSIPPQRDSTSNSHRWKQNWRDFWHIMQAACK